jgi:hypothetical protein
VPRRASYLLHDAIYIEENLLCCLLQTFFRVGKLGGGIPKHRRWRADEKQHEKGHNRQCSDPSHEKVDNPSSHPPRVESPVKHEDAKLHEADCHNVEQSSRKVGLQHRCEVFGGNVGSYTLCKL